MHGPGIHACTSANQRELHRHTHDVGDSHDPGEDGAAASNEGSHDSEKIVVKHEALRTQGVAWEVRRYIDEEFECYFI